MSDVTDDVTGQGTGEAAFAEDGPYLEGVRVLDFTQYLAGPSCTRLLAELGADVIKVEMPPWGDPTRAGVPRRNGRAGGFIQQNRGKRSLCVDLQRPEGIELVKALVPHVDVLVENYSHGVMARRGLDYESLSAINPRLIMASVTGFGQTGPLRHKTCFDFIAQAYAGVMHMTGDPEGPPTFVGHGLGDTNAGFHAFAGVGYALYRRDRTGRGAHIDISMVDALFHMQETAVHAASMTDGEFVPDAAGPPLPAAVPGRDLQGSRGLDRDPVHPGPDGLPVGGAGPARAGGGPPLRHEQGAARAPRRADRADRGVDGELRA